MGESRTLLAAAGWVELGIADEALRELGSLPPDERNRCDALEIQFAAHMLTQEWNLAADAARLLCLQPATKPDYFLWAAFCLHETGDTLAACRWLLRGPKSLIAIPMFHYNLACYLWTLGKSARARSHLQRAISMDESLRQVASRDRDLLGIGPIDP